MTVQEAIKILNPETSADALLEIGYYGGFNGKMAQIQAVIYASLVAIESMEKQIPKKPINKECPICEEPIPRWDTRYCPNCGQALKWGEEDD